MEELTHALQSQFRARVCRSRPFRRVRTGYRRTHTHERNHAPAIHAGLRGRLRGSYRLRKV